MVYQSEFAYFTGYVQALLAFWRIPAKIVEEMSNDWSGRKPTFLLVGTF